MTMSRQFLCEYDPYESEFNPLSTWCPHVVLQVFLFSAASQDIHSWADDLAENRSPV
jgi:hypothetical protein